MTFFEVRSHRDIIYQTLEGRECFIDIHVPTGHKTAGTVVYFHGGGLETGTRTDYEETRAIALAKRGIPVVTVQYRFLQDAPLPASIEDAKAAVGWIRSHASEYGIEGGRIGAWGASAGGYLAALLATGDPQQDKKPDVECAVIWFAAFDLVAMGALSSLEYEIFGASPVEGMLGRKFDKNDPLHRSLNPIGLASGNSAPMLLVTGDRDKIIEPAQSIRMHETLVQHGAESTLMVIGGAGHEDPLFDGSSSAGYTAAFFADQFERS